MHTWHVEELKLDLIDLSFLSIVTDEWPKWRCHRFWGWQFKGWKISSGQCYS